MRLEKIIACFLFAAFAFSAQADWLVKTYRDGSAVNGLADADRLITNTSPIATGTIPQTDMLGFSTGEGTGHFSLNYPVPGITQSQATDNYAVEVTGSMVVSDSGNYTFGLNTDDGARLRIDGANVIVDDVRSGPHDSPYVTIYLAAGSHAVEWTWFNEAGGVNGGGAEGEAFWAEGTYSSFNSNFALLVENGTAIPTNNPSSPPNLNSGLIAYWPFNGDANDISENGNNCVVYGAQLTSDRFGNPNSAYSFDGSSSYLECANISGVTNMGTVSAWIFKTSTNPSFYETIFASDLYRFSTLPQAQLIFNTYAGDWFEASPILPMQLGVWHHVAFVKDASSAKLYQDGVLIFSVVNGNTISSISKCRIGANGVSGYGGVDYFNGKIDDVRIYNRALSASEIQQLYSLPDIGSAPTPPTLVPTNRTPTSAEIGVQTNGVLRMFTNGAFTNVFNLDPSKITIVLTHGWNDNSDGWPSNMASQFAIAGISANIVAWDWRSDAKQNLPETALLKTPAQGYALGTNLLQNLGAGYSQPIHFIGHSFGTEVNAAAANYLEANSYSSANIQMTLLDEAEIANDLTIVSPTTFNLSWIKPLPNNFAWSDNYISLVGELQENANSVNVILTEGQPGAFYISANDLFNDMKAYHAVPCQWYAQTITNPSGSVMGNIWSFERNSNFTSPAGGTFFEQQGSGLVLNQIPQALAEYLQGANAISFKRDLGELFTLKVADAGVSVVGDVTANVIEWSLSDPNPVFQTTPATIGISTYAPASPDFWSPQLVLQNHPLNFQPNLKSSGVHPLDDPSPTPANSPAYAWLPMTIPTNVTSMSFDFMLQGDGASDSVAAALNGTNVFSLAASLIQTNVTMNSGLIDVSQYAGTNVELFLGVVGGTSTNTSLTVSGIRLYSIAPPSLQAQASGNNFVLNWPLSASDYTLENSTDLISWTTNTDVSVIVNLQNAITNSISGGARFYRLKK